MTRCRQPGRSFSGMENLISIALDSIFVGNILLAYFLGMCSFLAVSKNMQTAAGLGVAVIFVLSITAPTNWLIYHFLLAPGALSWAGLPGVDLSFLKLVLFIASIAAMVQAIEMIIDRFSPGLYAALGVFLPLITVNCAILGGSLFMVERSYTFSETVVYGAGSGAGWALAIISMSAIQKKLRYADVPDGLQGFAINMITTGLMAIGFMLFAGISL
jgi:Na+-transporting NADH:ubiquinone oxidoreductase subunit E